MPRTDRRAAADTVLWWCSEKGSGQLKELAGVCDELRVQPWDTIRALSALAHLEIDWRDGLWSVCEPVLTTVPGLPGRLLLCGARPSGLLEDLRVRAEGSGLDVIVDTDPIPQVTSGPATLYLKASAADAASFALVAGIRFQPAAHLAIAALLPPAELETVAEPATPDPRFPHCVVDPDTLRERWDRTEPEGAEGLWAWQTWARRSARYLRRDGQWWYVPDNAWAPYLIDRPGSDPLCRYEPAHQVLIVDTATPLPALQSRSATLCSGRTALRQHLAEGVAEDHYVNVDERTAELIIRSLSRRETTRSS